MRWSFIRIESVDPSPARGEDAAHWYEMQLPLIADGRLAWAQIGLHPDKARVERFGLGTMKRLIGRLMLLENQWTCVWQGEDEGLAANVRLIGARFSLGDAIGMRPLGGALSLYKVRHRSLLPLAGGLAQCAAP